MAITPFKTFISGEVLTASDLNSSFTRITDNGEDLPFPSTQAVDFDGQNLILDADADTYFDASTDDIVDLYIQNERTVRFRNDGSVDAKLEMRSNATDANPAPSLSVYRDSASPADNDELGQILFDGENDADEQTTYGSIVGQLLDATDATEDGGIRLYTMIGGTLTRTADAQNSSGMQEFRVYSADAGAGEGPYFVMERASASPSASDLIGVLRFVGKNTTPANVSYGKVLGKILASTAGAEYSGVHTQAMVNGTLTTLLQVGTTATSTDARSKFSADGGPALEIDRLTDDGVIMQVSKDSSVKGNLHTNATTGRMAIGMSAGVTLFITSGTGDPESAISASVGSLYLRTDGGAGSTLYVKESGTGNTGWAAK